MLEYLHPKHLVSKLLWFDPLVAELFEHENICSVPWPKLFIAGGFYVQDYMEGLTRKMEANDIRYKDEPHRLWEDEPYPEWEAEPLYSEWYDTFALLDWWEYIPRPPASGPTVELATRDISNRLKAHLQWDRVEAPIHWWRRIPQPAQLG